MNPIPVIAVALCWLVAGSVSDAKKEVLTHDLKFFLRRLQNPDHLPELERSHTAMSSTWDREGGNSDGTDFKRIEGDRNILLDVDGPGCVHRIFTGKVGSDLAGTRIRIYFDNATSPALDLEVNDFFDFKHGPLRYPMVFHKTYPGTFFPMPFAKHCRMELHNPLVLQEPPGRKKPSKKWGNYWQVTYTSYAETVPVKTLQWPLSPSDTIALEKTCQRLLEAESLAPAAPSKWTLRKSITLPSNAADHEVLTGSAVIRQVRLKASPDTPETFQKLSMRLEWDGSGNGAVDMPIGYFFGHVETGHATEYHSLLVGVTTNYAYCTFPMPFAKGAIIKFQNHSAQAVNLELSVDTRRCVSPPDNLGRFHASFEQTEIEEHWANLGKVARYGRQKVPVHRVLEVDRQRGKYVGVFLHVDWPRTTWWGEGDWLIWADHKHWPPDYHGTGTEEYFNCGWGKFDRKATSGIIKEPQMWPGHVGVYSFHLNDFFCFDHYLRVAVELWPLDLTPSEMPHAFWRSTAYWYEFPACR